MNLLITYNQSTLASLQIHVKINFLAEYPQSAIRRPDASFCHFTCNQLLALLLSVVDSRLPLNLGWCRRWLMQNPVVQVNYIRTLHSWIILALMQPVTSRWQACNDSGVLDLQTATHSGYEFAATVLLQHSYCWSVVFSLVRAFIFA